MSLVESALRSLPRHHDTTSMGKTCIQRSRPIPDRHGRIDREVRQCFRTAGLLEDEPDKDVVLWWDLLCHEIRGIQNFDNFMQGRLAEQKSFQYEKERLRRLGISAEPKWQAIDDNTLGYDILSFKEGGEFPARLLIEVKSSSRNPPAVIISRNEWIKANQAGDSYVFHFWDIRAAFADLRFDDLT